MRIEFTAAEVNRLAAYPLPWFSDTARIMMGKPPLTQPEVDITKGVLFYDNDAVDSLDVWFVEVLRAGWAYVDSDSSFKGLEDVQAALDWAKWEELAEGVANGMLSQEEAVSLATTYLINISVSLGISVPVSLSDG